MRLSSRPTVLPATTRISPIGTRIYAVSATLIRFNEEQDSDFHLVLSDGSHTMIAEIPSPSCVEYQVTNRMHYVRTEVTVIGVGFVDFLQEQNSVAPNGIELHPVLSVQFAGGKPPISVPPPTK